MKQKIVRKEDLLEINFDLTNGIFSKTTFSSNNIERIFIERFYSRDTKYQNYSNLILMSFYIIIFIYCFIFFSKPPLLIGNVCFFLMAIIIIIVEKFPCQTFKKKNICFEFIQILLICFNFNFIFFTMSFKYIDAEKENIDDLIKLIPFIYSSTNILIFLKLKGDILNHMFFHGINSISIIITEFFFNKRHINYLEIFFNLLFSFFFYLLKKFWEIKLRESFGREYRYRLFCKIYNEFFQVLNDYHLIIKEGKYYSLKSLNFEEYLEDEGIGQTNFLSYFKDDSLNSKIIDRSFTSHKFYEGKNEKKNINDFNGSKDNSSYFSKHSCNDLLENMEKIDFEITNNQNNLKFTNKNINFQNNINVNFNIINQSIKNSGKQKSRFCKNSKDVLHNYYKVRIKEKKIEKNLNNQKIEEKEEKDEIIYFLKKFKKEKLPSKISEENLMNNISECNYNEFQESLHEILEKINEKNIKKKLELKKINKNLDKNLDNYKNNIEISKQTFDKRKSTKKKFLGLFQFQSGQFNSQEDIRYFEIYLRKIKISDLNFSMQDLIFNDITESNNIKQKILDEKVIKGKIFAKIIHEFKTPLNSLIILIDNLKKSYKKTKNSKNKLEKNSENLTSKFKNKCFSGNTYNLNNGKDEFSTTFSLIKSLSNYLTFLISDIINYSNPDQVQNLKIIKTKVNLKSVLNFSYKILKTLLSFNKNKKEKINPELFIDEDLENCEIIADEHRLKQILLNFISNSVKFTSIGVIKIEAKLTKLHDFRNDENRKMTQNSLLSNKTNLNDNKTYSIKSNNKRLESITNDSLENDFNNKNILELKIKDSGKGIKEEDQRKIFSDFSKLNNEKENISGSGLGLSICKTLCEKMNYDISFFSKFQEGSVFCVKIPQENIDLNMITNKIKAPRKYSNSVIYKQPSYNYNVVTDMDSTLSNNFMPINYLDFNNKKLIFNNEISVKLSQRNSYHLSSLHLSKKNIVKSMRSEVHPENSKEKIKFFKDMRLNINDDLQEYNSDFRSTKKNSIINYLHQSNITNSVISNFNKKEISKISKFQNDSIRINKIAKQSFINMKFNKTVSNDIIILADDNHLMIDSHKNIISDYLKENNLSYEILLCYDGAEILKQLLDEKIKKNIKYIITDENMETINGSDAIRIIRFLQSKNFIKKIKIVSLSSYEDSNSLNSILQAGADEVLVKPLVKSLLKKII